jgi:coenzyme Q-binding protein COQ10
VHSHSEQKFLPYAPEQVFDLVADVEAYPEFLPWCVATRVLSRSETAMRADMAVGYKGIQERYTSDIRLDRQAGTIGVTAIEGPFKTLENNWRFEATERDGVQGCLVHFDIRFAFGSWLLERVISAFFQEVVRKMVSAFEARAHVVYNC